MSDHSSHDVSKEVRKYVLVFVALLVGTVITVAVSYLHIPNVPLTIAIALFIATIKAFLVAGYFMHLISERKMIYSVLATTAFFVTGLMFLTIWAMHDYPVLPGQ